MPSEWVGYDESGGIRRKRSPIAQAAIFGVAIVIFSGMVYLKCFAGHVRFDPARAAAVQAAISSVPVRAESHP
jgi:hypothetical protein